LIIVTPEGLSAGRILHYAVKLRRIAELLGKDFQAAAKGDIEKVVQKIERAKYSDWTKHSFKVTLKKFYKWLAGSEEYPEQVKWIKSTVKEKGKLPEELLTEDEIKALIEAAEHPRDKALVSVLYESGCRVGELASLRIKNVSFDRYGAKLIVRGKTGMRRIRIIASTPYLSPG
jgi:site-specific recombinase XerD